MPFPVYLNFDDRHIEVIVKGLPLQGSRRTRRVSTTAMLKEQLSAFAASFLFLPAPPTAASSRRRRIAACQCPDLQNPKCQQKNVIPEINIYFCGTLHFRHFAVTITFPCFWGGRSSAQQYSGGVRQCFSVSFKVVLILGHARAWGTNPPSLSLPSSTRMLDGIGVLTLSAAGPVARFAPRAGGKCHAPLCSAILCLSVALRLA